MYSFQFMIRYWNIKICSKGRSKVKYTLEKSQCQRLRWPIFIDV